jgi:hypothetical protein
VFRKHTHLTFGLTFLGLVLPAAGARGQAPPQFYIVCSSQQNLPTVYMSGVMQGPAAAIQGFTAGFNQFLKQTYSYQGAVACVPGRTIANAQTFVQSRSTALRNLKKNVVETGWAESAPGLLGGGVAGTTTNVITGLLAGGKSNTAAPGASQAPVAGQPAGTNVTEGGNSAPGAPVVQIFNNLFAGGSTPSTGSSGAASSNAGGASAAKASANSAAAGKSSAGAGSSTSTEVATVLSTLFSKAPAGGSAAGGAADAGASAKSGKNNAVPGRAAQPQPGPAAEPAPAVNGLPDGALGMAQFGNSKLVVYGCGRQGTQVLCVTDLTNQNPQDTLVHGDTAWKDAFLVDDRGDRHARIDGYFLNVDGDRRQEMDIEYGKSAHFILAFDAVQAKVEKVTLRSTTGGLHVADIALIVPGAPGNSGEAQSTTNQPQNGTSRR